MRPLLALLLATALVAATAERRAHAEDAPAVEPPCVVATLLAEDAALVPGRTHWLGVRLRIQEGWHESMAENGMAPKTVLGCSNKYAD